MASKSPNNSLEEIISVLKQAKTVVLSTHVLPDPDAVGSTGALYLGLQSLGVEVQFYLQDPVPSRMKPFLDGVQITDIVPSKKFGAFIAVDTASRPRVGKAVDKVMELAESTVTIDHHISNEGWAQHNYIEGNASSSAEIIEKLLRRSGVNITPQIATLLYSGLADDTGCFRYSNTSAESLQCAARLVAAGAEPQEISNSLYFSTPERVLRLRALTVEKMERHFGGALAMSFISTEMLTGVGASAEDAEGLVDELRSIEGTRAAVLVRQMNGEWKLSLRAKDESIDVNSIASSFGGGGHKAAAGCRIAGPAPEVREKILDAFKPILNKQN